MIATSQGLYDTSTTPSLSLFAYTCSEVYGSLMHRSTVLYVHKPGSLICKDIDAYTSLAMLLTKHWYTPEWAVVSERILILPSSSMLSPVLAMSTSPLKYHTTFGVGVPASIQEREILSPTNLSKSCSSGKTPSIAAGSVYIQNTDSNN